MFKQLKKQPDMVGVANDVTAVGIIPTEGTHHSLLLNILGATVAQAKSELNDIRVKVNGETFVEATPTFLFDLQKFYGDCVGAGNVATIIPIEWELPHLPSDAERTVYALGMADVSSYVVEVDCGTLTNVTGIEVFSEVTPIRRRLGQHRRINRFPQNYTVTGIQEIVTLPKEGNDVGYLALHIAKGATGVLTIVTCKVGGLDIVDRQPIALNQVLLNKQRRTPQTGYEHIDFARSRDLGGLLPMANVQDFRQNITWTTAPNAYNIYTERVFGLNIGT